MWVSGQLSIAGENGQGMCQVQEEVDFFSAAIVTEYLNGLAHSHSVASHFMIAFLVINYSR